MSRAGPIPSAGPSELERLRQAVSARFPVYETRIGPQSVLFAVHVDPASLSEKFDGLRKELGPLGYIPVLRRETGEQFVEVVRKPKLAPRHLWINLVLLAATVATTVFAGAMLWLSYVGRLALAPTDFLYGGVYFAAPLLAILGVHETAHYVVARHHHLDASLPYFIPVPPPYILGTFGAFVSIREPFPDRRTLFDVGAAGPLAGFAMSIPIALAGLSLSVHSPVLPANYCGPSILGQSYGNLLLGPSLFWYFLSLFFPPSLLSLHPLALAGWVGVLVTAINLLPAGQLDGGHVFRALVGDRARFVSYGAAAALFGMGLFYLGWILFALLVLLIGLRHPPPLNDVTPLDRRRMALGIGVAAILITGFVIVPLALPPGSISLSGGGAEAVAPPHGAQVAAVLNVSVLNGDPIPHGFVYTFAVTGVELNATTNLSGVGLSRFDANASWVLRLANGTAIGPFGGGSVTLPSSDFVTIGGGARALIVAEFYDNDTAHAASFSFHTSELCPTASGGGSASASPWSVEF